MLLRQMKYFVAVVDCNSFTKAAEQCYISQSAISQQISALENEIGVELIKREKRKFSLTPAGEYFYRHCLGVIDEIDRLTLAVQQIGNYDDQSLTIGIIKNIDTTEIREAISLFSEIYPEVQIHITSGTHEELYDLLRFGKCDMVLNDQRRAFSQDYINFHLVYSKCFIEISIHNALSKLEYVTLDELRSLPCILISSKEQENHESEYYQKSLGYGGNFLYASDQSIARVMVAANKGFMPLDETKDQSNDQTIKRIPLYSGNIQMTRNYCLFWKKDINSYYVEEFANMLFNIFNSEVSKDD